MNKKNFKKPPVDRTSAHATEVVRFYRANEKPYGAFSNLYKSPVRFEGKVYPTAEHAYQAGKARKTKVRDWILAAPSPSLAAMAAHGLYTWEVVSNWNAIKFDRMRGVLRAKFTQHAELRRLLIATGDARLVETGTVNSAVNRLWGEVNGVGENMLGQMLMDLRKELATERPDRALAKSGNKRKGRKHSNASQKRKSKDG